MTTESEDNGIAIEAAAKVVEEHAKPESDIIELTNGVKLRCKSVAVMTIRHATAALPRPIPPVIENPDKGRAEPWEGDPAYQDALGRWEYQIGETSINIMLSLGTKLEYVPENMDSPEDSNWVEILEAAEVPLKLNSVPARYLSWLRFYALSDPEDIAKVSVAIARKSGLMEGDVSSALESFRGGEDGGTNLPKTTEELSSNGNNIPLPISRPRAGS